MNRCFKTHKNETRLQDDIVDKIERKNIHLIDLYIMQELYKKIILNSH